MDENFAEAPTLLKGERDQRKIKNLLELTEEMISVISLYFSSILLASRS